MCSGSKPKTTKYEPEAVPAAQVAEANVEKEADVQVGSDTLDETRRKAQGKRNLRVQLGTGTGTGTGGAGLAITR